MGANAVRRLAGTVLLVAAVMTVLIAEAGALAEPAIPRNAIRVDIGAAPDGRPLPPGFIGLSIEYRSAPDYFGTDPSRPDPVFIQLMRNLDPGQSPVLRIGGDTTDWTWWPTPGVPEPKGIRYTLDPAWVSSTRAMAAALNARLILGIDLEADRPTVAATEATQLLDGIGPRYIAGLELGNEPEVYGTLPWYLTARGVPVPGRARTYGFAAYLRDYARISRALPTQVPLIGPASGAQQWVAGLSRFLAANRRVGMVTFHRYPLDRCYTAPSSEDYPTIANLLAPVASSGPATSLQSAVDAAHAHGMPLRADELNSVACGGAPGVSDTFASALWVLDTLFNMDQVGVDGVNVHTFRNAFYQPFAITDTDGQWEADVKPLYYGLLMFAQAAPPGSRLLPTRSRGPATLRIWVTHGTDGRDRVLLINDSRRAPVTVAVGAPAGAATADAIALRAPDVAARGDVTIGGQSFAPDTTTGLLTGAPQAVGLGLVQGRFVVALPAASATLLTIPASAAAPFNGFCTRLRLTARRPVATLRLQTIAVPRAVRGRRRIESGGTGR